MDFIDFILALSLSFSVLSTFITVICICHINNLITVLKEYESKSVPVKQDFNDVETAVVKKDIPPVDPQQKWDNVAKAFNATGHLNGRSRTSKVLDN